MVKQIEIVKARDEYFWRKIAVYLKEIMISL